MNRQDISSYQIDSEPPGGEEEDFPNCPVRGNVRNRNWYNVLYNEDLNIRLHSRATTQTFQPYFPHGHHVATALCYLEQTAGTQYDHYFSGGFVVEDFHVSLSFRQIGTHAQEEWSAFVAANATGYEGLDIVSAVVIDHQYNSNSPSIEVADVFNLQPDFSANPTIPLRQARPDLIARYEVIAYDIVTIKPHELWESNLTSVQYKSAEEPIPVTTHYIYQKKFEIDRNTRFACKDLHLPIDLLGPIPPGGTYRPLHNNLFVIAYYRDPRQNDLNIFPNLTMEMEFQSRCYHRSN